MGERGRTAGGAQRPLAAGVGQAGADKAEAVSAASDAQLEAVGRQAFDLMSLDLGDLEARRHARQVVMGLGPLPSGTPSTQVGLTMGQLRGLIEGGSAPSGVADSLSELAKRMRRLDPSKVDFERRSLVARLRDPVERYFAQFADARNELGSILVSLKRGRDTLSADNVELERQEVALLNDSHEIEAALAYARELHDLLAVAVERLEGEGQDPERVRFVRGELLAPLERKRQDLQTLLTVNEQSIAATTILRQNNRALISSIDRASQISLRALDTGVAIARALHDQRRQQEDIRALKESFGQALSAVEEGQECLKRLSGERE